MINDVFTYALKQVPTPEGRVLWLYGDPRAVTGNVYNPLHSRMSANKPGQGLLVSDLDDLGHDYDAVFVNCPKQQDEAEGLIALALDRSRGFVMAAAPNDAGGSRLEKMLGAYDIHVDHLSKNRHRIVWTTEAKSANPSRLRQQLEKLSLTSLSMGDEHWATIPGLFGWNKIDAGSSLLMQHIPQDLKGAAADFGCGYGYLTVTLARLCKDIEKIDAYDIDTRALMACQRNANEKIPSKKISCLWQDMKIFLPQPLYDVIVMNPPFHNGRKEDIALGEDFIQKAWQSLKPGGQLFFVANRHLPYERIVPGLKIIFEGEGFKVITGVAP